MKAEWFGEDADEYSCEPIVPEVEVTEPDRVDFLDADGVPLFTVSDRPPFGFCAPS